ncbi:MAG: alpha/beta-type small acid-soluble spore protein [Limnochordaceae bacterium]|nr:alpha/beta-type small acid-soluble spore protein [Limnochordaceae bacterium]
MTETPQTPARRYRWRRPKDTQDETGAQGPASGKEELKHEVARELGLEDDLQDPDELSVREAGKIGGQMVRRLIQAGKEQMMRKRSADEETR